jgi:hypothetical protein
MLVNDVTAQDAMPGNSGMSFDEFLRAYPERRLTVLGRYRDVLRSIPRPLNSEAARDIVLDAMGPNPRRSRDMPLWNARPLTRPLRGFIIGSMKRNAAMHDGRRIPCIGNVIVPVGAQVSELRDSHMPGKGRLQYRGFKVNTIAVDSVVALDTFAALVTQMGAIERPLVDGHFERLWLGMNSTTDSKPFVFYVDQGSAAKDAGLRW